MANRDRSALVVGASGLVGGHCLNALLGSDSFSRVVSLGRRTLDLQHPKLIQEQIDFERLPDDSHWLTADDVFCCLGTTIAKAGSREAFARVDRDYPVTLARTTLLLGAKQFLLVSSVGADPESSNFYLRTKGEVERDISALGFAAVHIFRPSMLLGERREFRWKEKAFEPMMKALSWTMVGRLSRYRPIEARTVAGAMVRAAIRNRSEVNVYEGVDLVRLAAD